MSSGHGVDPTDRTFVRYIDKSRDYYLARGYPNPYRWAHFDDVPFAPLACLLSEAVVTVITTAMPTPDAIADTQNPRRVWSMPSDTPTVELSTDGLFWDRQATHTDDLDSYFPVHRLREFVRDGRIGRLAARLHGVPTEYSQRRTIECDAPEILHRCREDGANAAVLVPL